jgi:hypothetical protein
MSRYLYSTTVSMDVDIDVTESDLSNQDLLEICQERGIVFGHTLMEELAVHFKLKQHDQILEKVRKLVQDAKGVVL